MENFRNDSTFDDTRMIEPDEEMFFDTSDKILKLSDQLAEEIIMENIEAQMDEPLDVFSDRLNYVSLFREKYGEITPDNDAYDKEYLEQTLAKVCTEVLDKIEENYSVTLGTDLDYYNPDEYLKDIETLYEFLFVRQYENIVNYFQYKLRVNREAFLDSYSELLETEPHSKDLFVIQSKRKFKNVDDVVIMHFMNEIIDDIIGAADSGFNLIKDMINTDLFEEYNDRMNDLLENYGNKLVITNDAECAHKILAPLKDPNTRSELKNTLLMKYLEGCELN